MKNKTHTESPSEFLFDFFLDRKTVLLYGATSESRYMIKNYRQHISGIIDRKFLSNSTWEGIPCYNSPFEFCDVIFINCVTCDHTLDVEILLKETSNFVINFFDFIDLLLPNSQFKYSESNVIQEWEVFPNVFVDKLEIFHKIKDCFQDKTSKIHFKDYLDARLTGDIPRIGQGKITHDPSTMYFQPFLPDLDEYVFLDIGCFDGSNSESFLSQTNGSCVIAFEPNSFNVSLITDRLKRYTSRFTLVNSALGDDRSESYITIDGPGSIITDDKIENSEKVVQETLDGIFERFDLWDKKTLIKMDVEGSELNILNGAKKVVGNQNTIWAISCYHKSDDLVNFYCTLNKLIETNKIYFRHLTRGACESVLFII
jgi:FkbM family methyltransferase